MKRHLNTLFVTTQGTYLAKDGETVAVKLEGDTRLRVPLLNLAGIVTFGNVTVSPFLLGACGERGIGLSFLTENGRFLARATGPTAGNVLLRREQYRWADDPEATANVTCFLLSGKLINSRSFLLRSLRDHPGAGEDDSRRKAASELGRILGELPRAADTDALRGLEGLAAKSYFGAFDALVVQQREGFRFVGRSRRPPLDAVNALLSFLYALLRHDVASALETVGLDPQVGFLHRDRPGRPGLALDLMEELRPLFADRLAVNLINLKRISPSGFRQAESGGIEMDDDTRKAVLTAYQERKQEEVLHPFLEERVTLGLVPHLQARLLARFLRGDLDGYPPYLPR
jgi:CRISPR-associated protein Cas1